MSLPYKPDSSVAAISGFSSYLEQGTKIIKVQVSLGAQMENTLHCCLNKCCCFFTVKALIYFSSLIPCRVFWKRAWLEFLEVSNWCEWQSGGCMGAKSLCQRNPNQNSWYGAADNLEEERRALTSLQSFVFCNMRFKCIGMWTKGMSWTHEFCLYNQTFVD